MSFNEFSQVLCFSYGEGMCIREGHLYTGEIILSTTKLYLKSVDGEMSATFIPLERIYKIRLFLGGFTIYVHQSNFIRFQAKWKGGLKEMWSLAHDLADHRRLKKKFFGLEWEDPDFFHVL